MPSTSADRLRHARQLAGYPSAAAAARAHSWGEAAYRHHENGTRPIGVDNSITYGLAFGVSSSWLVGLSDDMNLSSPSSILESSIEGLSMPATIHHLDGLLHEFVGARIIRACRLENDSLQYISSDDDLPQYRTVMVADLPLSVPIQDVAAVFVADRDWWRDVSKSEWVIVDLSDRTISGNQEFWLAKVDGHLDFWQIASLPQGGYQARSGIGNQVIGPEQLILLGRGLRQESATDTNRIDG